MIKLLFIFILLFSCTKKDELPNYSREEIFEMAREVEPNLELVLPKSIGLALVHCSHYNPPCQNGYKVKVKGLELTALRYDSQEKALLSAKSIDGMYTRNWVFDDAKGEPILERFVKKAFNAKYGR